MTTPAPQRWIEYMPLDDVLPALKNPKGHDDQMIETGISAHGLIDAPALDERTGRLVAGHGRLNDAKRRRDAGESPPDGIVADPETGTWLIPVQRGWASVSDDHAHAAGLILNRATAAGGFKSNELADLLAELDRNGVALPTTGFTNDDLDSLLASLAEPTPDLSPQSPDTQPRMDQINPVACPACGHLFHPAPANAKRRDS